MAVKSLIGREHRQDGYTAQRQNSHFGQRGVGQYRTSWHHSEWCQLKTHELFIFRIFHLILLDFNWLWVTETTENEIIASESYDISLWNSDACLWYFFMELGYVPSLLSNQYSALSSSWPQILLCSLFSLTTYTRFPLVLQSLELFTFWMAWTD